MAQLCFGGVLKRSLSVHCMQVKLLFVTFNMNCRLHTVSVRKPSERCPMFGRLFSKLNLNQFPVFHTSLHAAFYKIF